MVLESGWGEAAAFPTPNMRLVPAWGPGLSPVKGKGGCSSEQQGSLNFSPVQLPLLVSP